MNTYNTIQITLSEGKTSDVYELRKCNKDCLPVYYPYGFYNNVIDSNKNIVLLAKNKNNVIGYIIGELSDEIPERFHIISFGVKEQFRSKKIGTHLMKKIFELAPKRYFSVKKISLYVMANNNVAIKFYESIGFLKDKVMKNYYQSFNQDGYLYIKNI